MAELAAIVVMIKEGQFVLNIEQDMGVKSTILHVVSDSKSGVDIVKNPGVTKRSAHYDRVLHYGRELYMLGGIKIWHTPDSQMMADGLTKVVEREKFLKCRNYMMNVKE